MIFANFSNISRYPSGPLNFPYDIFATARRGHAERRDVTPLASRERRGRKKISEFIREESSDDDERAVHEGSRQGIQNLARGGSSAGPRPALLFVGIAGGPSVGGPVGDGSPGLEPPAARLRRHLDVGQARAEPRGAPAGPQSSDSALPSELEQRHGRRQGHEGAQQRQVLLGAAPLAEDLRDEHDVRDRHEEGPPARRHLHEPSRQGRPELGALPQGPPVARRPLDALHQALQRERRHQDRHPLRRRRRHVNFLQRRTLPRHRVQGPQRGQAAPLPDRMLDRGQDRDAPRLDEEGLREPAGPLQGGHSEEGQT